MTSAYNAWTKSISNLPSYNVNYPEGTFLPLSTRLGPVRLSVTSAEDALAVWQDLIGLHIIEQDAQNIILGAEGKPLIELEVSASAPAPSGVVGLYHVAIHVPTRRDLAIILYRLMQAGYRNSPVDHLVNEVTYLSDMDGNGIEINFETPERGYISYNEEEFNRTGIAGYDNEGKPHSAREQLDLNALFQELGPDPKELLSGKLSADTYIGHLHLTVDDIDPSMTFYRDIVGFKQAYANQRFGVGDMIVDHPPHIIAVNTWKRQNASQPATNAAGLQHFTIEVPSVADLSALVGRLEAADIPTSVNDDNVLSFSDPTGNIVKTRVSSSLPNRTLIHDSDNNDFI